MWDLGIFFFFASKYKWPIGKQVLSIVLKSSVSKNKCSFPGQITLLEATMLIAGTLFILR